MSSLAASLGNVHGVTGSEVYHNIRDLLQEFLDSHPPGSARGNHVGDSKLGQTL